MITQPYVNFILPDAGGNVKPISNGTIYIGQEGLDPKLGGNQIYYRDNEGTEVEISSPLYLNATGVIVDGPNSSNIINPYTKESISILILDRNGKEIWNELIYSKSLSSEYVIATGGSAAVSIADRFGFIKTVHDFGIVGDGSDESSKLEAAILACNNGSLDLMGMTISTGAVSVSVESTNIYSSVPGATFKILGSLGMSSGVKITTTSAFSSLWTKDFTVDGGSICAKPFYIENSVTGDVWVNENVTVINATQNESSGIAAGHYLSGGFAYVEMNSPRSKNITSVGGSEVASGIRTEQNGDAVSQRIIINKPDIEDVPVGQDGDGIALLQNYPLTTLGVYEINGGKFQDCHKRAIKTQCWKTIVRVPYIVRTEAHTPEAGNVDIDIQYGNGEIVNPIFDYSSPLTVPQGGLISLMPERGSQDGRSTNVIGGTVTIRNKGLCDSPLFFISTFDANDKCRRPTVKAFESKGTFKNVCLIRPLASQTFNDNVVLEPKFIDCTFESITQTFFSLDRSGTGYAYTKDASVLGCRVLSRGIALDSNVTTQVGITYALLDGNYNIGDLTTSRIVSSIYNVADNVAYSKSITAPIRSGVEVTATYNSSAGNNYHAVRKSILTLGDATAEALETNIVNVESRFGGWSFNFVAEVVDGKWQITVNKPVGSSTTGGSVQIVASSASVIY